MDHFEKFEDVIAILQKKKRLIHLLLGNGFSMAYDPSIFSYNALADFVIKLSDPTLTKLFEILKTKNFELIMEQLSTFSSLLATLGAEKELQDQVDAAHLKLKLSLLDAIRSLHPEHVFKIPEEKMIACAKFLHLFLDSGGQVFSTNYDLLLYWVLMRQQFQRATDGFGRELLNPMEVIKGEEKDFSELRWGPNKSSQNIHFVHGTLPLFDTGVEIIKEQYSDEGYLLENVGARLDKGEYPIFVTAGNGAEKLSLIRHNRYLSHCYDKLCEVDGSVVTFGFGFGQYDEHIIDALNKATHAASGNAPPKLRSVYIGTFSDADVKYIQSIEHKFHAKVYTFDVKSANPWH